MNPQESVWITGIGAATTLGFSYAEVADSLLAGRSGIKRVEAFDVSHHASQIAARLGDVPCPAGIPEATFTPLSRVDQSALWCGANALRTAGIWDDRGRRRIGLVLGLGSEWMNRWEETPEQPAALPPDSSSSYITRLQQHLGLSGPGLVVSTACASSNHAFMLARRWLQCGWVDHCLAGSCDMNATPMVLAAFGNMRTLSRRNDAPEAASRPFDRDRDGFVLGEGGALFLLERSRSARQRSAHVYGELAGCGASSDAYHSVIPSPEREPAVTAVRHALRDAGVHPGDVDYINAHGTATAVGDVAETNVLHEVFGEAIPRIPVSSTKSMTGHLLTGAAAVEAIACLAAIERQAVPPTINLDHPDPDCNLCHVPWQARPHRVYSVVSNAFGFGGSNSCVVFRAG